MRNLWILLAVTLAGAGFGIGLGGAPGFSRRLLPFSGGVLAGVALFWIFPEIGERYGWPGALCGIAAGFALVWLVDRFLYAVCPACSHTHDHADCSRRLHGFAAPLLAAASLHNFFDGWSLTLANQQASEGVRAAVLAGIGIHKLPEGLALGVLFLAATGSAARAWISCALVQGCMWIGGLAALYAGPHLDAGWAGGLLAVAAGVFVYLGYHAIESECRARGLVTAWLPALTGAAGAAVLRIVPGL